MALCARGRAAPGSNSMRTSIAAVGRNWPGRVTTSPRARALFSTPAMLTARRAPGVPSVTLCLWVCRPRMRPRCPPGWISTSCPTRRVPCCRVPVTTVPKPVMVKTRSMGRRGRPMSRNSSRLLCSSSAASSAARMLGQARAGHGGAGNDGRAGQGGGAQPLGDLLAHEVEPVARPPDRTWSGRRRRSARAADRGSPGAPRSAA